MFMFWFFLTLCPYVTVQKDILMDKMKKLSRGESQQDHGSFVMKQIQHADSFQRVLLRLNHRLTFYVEAVMVTLHQVESQEETKGNCNVFKLNSASLCNRSMSMSTVFMSHS